jgi:murein DD-endopeptidase MepM/ murein hydrolase activator NlpD
MKDKLIITISDTEGTKTYTLKKIIKKVALYLIVGIILLIGVSFWIITSLNTKVTNLTKLEQKLEIQKQKLKAQNKLYSLQIKDKIRDIEELGSTLKDIEEIIGINGEDETSLIKRATLAKLTSAQKTYILKTIPSGSPLKQTDITAKFGYRIHPISKKRHFHKGIDLRAKRKTKIYATADGVVKYTRVQLKGGFGTMVTIAHNYGFDTVYAHLNKILVKVGDVVKKGDVIALSGNTGYSTGPHLHYEIHYANKVVDPLDYINWNIKNYDTIFKKQRRVQWESLINLINNQVQHLTAQQ